MISQIEKISNLGLDNDIDDIGIRQKIIIANWFAIINLFFISVITVIRLFIEGLNPSILVPADNLPFLIFFLLIRKSTLKTEFMVHFFGYMFTVILFLNLTVINLFYYEMFTNADFLFAKFSFTAALIQAIILIPMKNKKLFISIMVINVFLFLSHDYFYHKVYLQYSAEQTLLVLQDNFVFVLNLSYFVIGGMVIAFLKIIENYQTNLNEINKNLKNKNLLLDEQNKNLLEQNNTISLQTDEIKKKNHELNQIVDDLHKVKFQLNEVISSKDKFISILAHDLKNGLFGLEISLEGLSKTCNSDIDKAKKRLSAIHKSAVNLSQMLDNILSWASTQLGKTTLNSKFFNIDELFEIVIPQIQPELERKGMTIEMDKKHKKQIYADINLLQVALRNLLVNAIKYSIAGSEIKISTSEDDSYQYINVIDFGTGISPTNQLKLFNIDEKFSLPGTSAEKGTGLGLILSKEYVELNDGELYFKSIFGNGTTFTLKMHIIRDNRIK